MTTRTLRALRIKYQTAHGHSWWRDPVLRAAFDFERAGGALPNPKKPPPASEEKRASRLKRLRIDVATDLGKVRTNQEDAFFVSPRLVAVFDGMGGMEGGEIASAIARDAVRDIEKEIATARAGARKWLIRNALSAADEEIGHRLYRQGGTTAVVLYVGADGQATVCHIGDSRAYLFRDEELIRLTQDHSYGGSMLSRALSGKGDAPDFNDFAVQPGDVLMLCTDGLTGELTDDQIAVYLGSPGPNPAKRLVDATLMTRAQDNVTVVVVRV